MYLELPPANTPDPVLDAYRKDVDIGLLRENLKLTVQERFDRFTQVMKSMETLRQAGETARALRATNVRHSETLLSVEQSKSE